MAILDIRPVVMGGGNAIVAVAGVTGSGKTYTALQIARGMVNKPSEIGFLDTENKRGSYYANKLDGQFMIADLYPPFSPSRYAQAVKEFQDAGIKTLIIDSISHEWEGEGGCDDIAAMKMGDSGMDNWVQAKREHKRFMNKALQCNMNLIFCIRAREKTDFKNPKKPVSLGLQPVCEKNFMFEMTASILVENEGKTQKFIKMPYFLKEAFGTGEGYITQATGKKIIEWVNTGEKEDPALAKIKSEMLMACEFGLAGVVAIWNTCTPAQKKKLQAHKEICKESAEEYERQAAQAKETPQDTLRGHLAKGVQVKIDMP